MEQFNGGTTRWCETEDEGVIFTPGKMLLPLIFAGIVEWRSLICFGIDRGCVIVFAVVTALAGEGQILEGVGATFAAGPGVFDGKGVHGKCLLTDAIFAAAVGSLNDRLAHRFGNANFRHIRSV